MPTPLDLLYVALFALAGPVWDYLVSWPTYRRQAAVDPVRARRRLWAGAIFYPWIVVGLGAALWMFHERSWKTFGFSLPEGWRLWTALGLILLISTYFVLSAATVARDPKTRATVRDQAGTVADLMPHTRTEMYWFGAVSLTAGFCEEFLFRGYFLWALSPWLGWWGAAALSLLIFAVGHAYQGVSGILRTGIVGALFTLVVAVFGSLWPAILLHFIWDLGMGVIAWFAMRDESPVEVAPATNS